MARHPVDQTSAAKTAICVFLGALASTTLVAAAYAVASAAGHADRFSRGQFWTVFGLGLVASALASTYIYLKDKGSADR